MESIGDASGNLDTCKQQGKQIIKKLDQRSPSKCSIEAGAYTFQYALRPPLMWLVIDGLMVCWCSYLLQDGVCYLTLSDRSFPKRLAFLYLEEIHAGFVDELTRDNGDRDWRDTVTTVARPYAFIKFGALACWLLLLLLLLPASLTLSLSLADKFIQKKRKEYTDPNSSQNMHRLNDDLADIHNIMRQNIQEVLNRGERVERTWRRKLACVSCGLLTHWIGLPLL